MELLTPIFGQKSYVFIQVKQTQSFISGNVPSGINKVYNNTDLGNALNKLSDSGFVVERMTTVGLDDFALAILLSKDSSASAIHFISADDNEEIYEVARYNLQGIPVKDTDKGIQVIVYSNFTTKAVFVE